MNRYFLPKLKLEAIKRCGGNVASVETNGIRVYMVEQKGEAALLVQ